MKSKDFSKEFLFKTSRSSGKGGQHVNKVESKVSLFLNIPESALLSDQEKEVLLNSKELNLSKEGILQIDVASSRSQYKNKLIAIERFYQLLSKSLKKKKIRKPTKPSIASIKKRLKQKKQIAEKKKSRKERFF